VLKSSESGLSVLSLNHGAFAAGSRTIPRVGHTETDAFPRAADGPMSSVGRKDGETLRVEQKGILVPAITVVRSVIVLDAAESALLAWSVGNGEMRRVRLSGKLFVFWQQHCQDSCRAATVQASCTKSRRQLAEL